MLASPRWDTALVVMLLVIVWGAFPLTVFARERGADGFVGFCYEVSSVQEHITAVGQTATREQTYMPHWAPRASWVPRRARRCRRARSGWCPG